MVKNKPKLIDHMLEIRRRLACIVLTLLAGATVAYFIRFQIIDALLSPLEYQQLIYTSPIGGFEFLIKICLFFGTLVTVPTLVYHVLRFLEPAMKKQTTRYLAMLVTSSSLLALGGATFAYFLSLPAALHFLANFTTENIQALLSTNEYLTFVMIYIAGFALLFQIPLVLLVINKMKPLSPRKLLSKSRIVILMSFIVAALITPTPDPINQSLMAMPIIVLYYAGIFLVWVANTRRKNVWYKDPVTWHGQKPRIDLVGVQPVAATTGGALSASTSPNPAPLLDEIKPATTAPQPNPAPESAPEPAGTSATGGLYHPDSEPAPASPISKFHSRPSHPTPRPRGNSHLFHRPPLHMNEQAQHIISPHMLDLSNES